jgi:K+ transporter
MAPIAWFATALYIQVQYVTHADDMLEAVQMVLIGWWWVTAGSLVIIVLFTWVECKSYKEEKRKSEELSRLLKSIDAKLDNMDRKIDRLIKANEHKSKT